MSYAIIQLGNANTNSSTRTDSRGIAHIPFLNVCHISDGSMSSMDAWFTSAGNKTSSAHFGVAKDGRIHQYVDIRRMAWANGIGATDIAASKTAVIRDNPGINPNLYSVSIEHEGTDGDLTEAQFRATVWLQKFIRDEIVRIYGAAGYYELDPYHIIGHRDVNPVGKPLCPGAKFPWARLYAELKGGASVSSVIVKERIYAEGGVLKRCDGNYKITAASDVRYIKFPAGKFRYKFVARKGAKVSDLVKEYGADYGTNAPYFWDGVVLGDSIADGKILTEAYGKMLKWHEFGFMDGKAQIGQLDRAKRWDVLVQGAPLLIDNGNLAWDYYRVNQEVPDDIGKGGAQRTVYGIDKEGAVHIAVADGRTKYDRGPTLEEMALYMQSKGCVWALNFDGGGSSVIADKTGSLGQNAGASERAVNHAMLIYAVKETAEVPAAPTATVPVKLDPGVAQTIINTWISPAWVAEKDVGLRDYYHWLADELRRAAGIKTE